MKAMMFGGAAAMLGGGLYIHGDLQGGQVYPLSIAVAYEKLAATDLPGSLGGSRGDAYNRGSTDSDVIVEREPNKSVTWKLRQDGSTIARFTADLQPVGDNATRVRVTFKIDEDGKLGSLGPKIAQSKFLATIAETGMNEQVDSVLDGRPYNAKVVSMQIATYMMTHRSEINQFMQDIQSSVEAEAANFRDYDGGYRGSGVARTNLESPDGPAKTALPMNSARPMVNTSGYGN
jgi:hypothetical protein